MAGTNIERQLLAEGPAIILVEPQMGENIAMARATMPIFS
ncbi:RNA methyltransferase, partial [Rhizobium leguminosarum]